MGLYRRTAQRFGFAPGRVRTPTVLQMEAVECGAASLGIILAYYGQIVPLEKLRIECGVSRDGSKASNILRAARDYGLNARGFKMEPQELRSVHLPAIVFWNFNHFLVVEGFGEGVVFLNDPASGPRVVTDEEFDHSFTGIVLAFETSDAFVPGGEPRTLLPALRRRLRGSEAGLIYVVLATLFLVFPGLVIPTFARVFVDNILVGGMTDWIKPLITGMILTAVLRMGLTHMQKHYLLRLETKLALGSSSVFFWHVLRLPIEFFSQRFGGEIGSRVIINNKVAKLLSGKLAVTALDVVMIVFYAGLMIQYDIVLSLIAFVSASVNIIALKTVSRKRKDWYKKLAQEQGKLTGTALSGLQMIETLKATGAETDFFSRWAGYESKVVNAKQDLGVMSVILTAIPALLMAFSTLAILCIGGLRVMDGYLTMGMLIAFQSLVSSFMGPVNDLVGMGGTLQEVEGDMNRLDDVLQYRVSKEFESDDSTDDDHASIRKLEGSLELRNLTFGYSKLEPPLIENFSLSMKPGMRIALVGGTGSGKSTIAKLVAGLYETWEGEILFDGKRREEYPRRTITNSLAMVDQEIFMFEGTVRENIALWDATIPETYIIQSAKDAAIHDDISARPTAYDSNLQEAGRNFSGGQRQRLEIARALAGNPTILIMDEATSALDTKTESLIDENLRRRGITCLIVAHRLSTIRDCDEIIVLERGKIVQRGTHDEMKNIDGPYAHLIES